MKLHEIINEQMVTMRLIDRNVQVPRRTTKLNYKNTIVTGNFDCSESKILSLEGAPDTVRGDFICYATKITSLEGGPSNVYGDYDCFNTPIISLRGAPPRVGGRLQCFKTNITNFEGAPKEIGSDFDCSNTEITSIRGIHKNIKHIGGGLILPAAVTSHVLGVMFIQGLERISFFTRNSSQSQVEAIINKHLAGHRNVHECQEELIEAGLKEYARL